MTESPDSHDAVHKGSKKVSEMITHTCTAYSVHVHDIQYSVHGMEWILGI